jgi:hypothetical protein
MWLLRTDKLDSLGLVEFPEEWAPTYAILSHTWGKEEVTFQDIQALGRSKWSRAVSQTRFAIQAKNGFVKIQRAADLAAKHGYGYIWVDTCCIDKTSSAELSEAINSMYRWYKRASVCYTYMEDVKYGYHDSKGGLFHLLCQHSRWFRRGWTLQELIAPGDVMFYGADWGYLGSKAHDEDVRISLAYITGIDVRILEGIIQPSEMSIATRMKWASQRETTRLEDMAYSLMGLFSVNMPLLYGEGEKAFIRLQEEILKGSNDHSIFTWKKPGFATNDDLCGLLAETPQHFSDVENYRPMPYSVSQGTTTWRTTNHGLQLSLFLIPCQEWNGNVIQDEYDAVLECVIRRGDNEYQSPVIRMRRLYSDQFARIDAQTVKCTADPFSTPVGAWGAYESIFVKQKPVYAFPEFMVSFTNMVAPSEPHKSDLNCRLIEVWPEKHWDGEAATLRTMPSHLDGVYGVFRFLAPAIGITVDYAVGLRKQSGGYWPEWHLQRQSAGEPLYQTAKSVNEYLAATRPTLHQPMKALELLGHSWREAEEDQRIRIRIEQISIHERRYNFIKASSAFELSDSSRQPLWGPSNSREQLSTPSKWPYTFMFNSNHELPSIFSLGVWGTPCWESLWELESPVIALGNIRVILPLKTPSPPVSTIARSANLVRVDNSVMVSGPTRPNDISEDSTMVNSIDYPVQFRAPDLRELIRVQDA